MLEIGSVIDGRYKILNEVGRGGMSVVYLAMNEKANKQWAVKEVRKDGRQNFEVVKQGLIVETDLLKKLRHPSLPSIIDVIDDKDSFLIVMDYIEGNPLSSALEESGAQPQNQVIAWAIQLCDVLGYLHAQSPPIIYRDMKPSNIMLKPDGNLTLIDFGTAREFKEKNLADTVCLGTIGYAAPEQFGRMGQTDARTDIYCLGATLYHLVTGQDPSEPPYEIGPIRQINPALSDGLERIIRKCTRRNPEDRYQSCAELMYALKHYDEIDEVYQKKQKKKLVVFLVSLFLTAACAGICLWGYFGSEQKKSENYDEILKGALDYQDYYQAILIDPTRKEAYEKLNDALTSDLILTKEEGQQLLQLQIGLDEKDSNGFSKKQDVLAELKNCNPEGYPEVCYEIGTSFLFFYDVNVDRDRYISAKKWFQEAVDQYPLAQIYCDIADCLELINQYDNAKVKQTDKMYDVYRQLWEKIQELKSTADRFGDVDVKLQLWTEINDMLNAQVVPFLEVTQVNEIKNLLNDILKESDAIHKSVIVQEIKNLQQKIIETVQKINSVQKEAGTS